MRKILVIILLAALASSIQGQHQARDWQCVRQPLAETADGNVVALQCVAALPKSEKLDAEDEKILSRLEIVRHNAGVLTSLAADERANHIIKGDQSPNRWSVDTGKGKETMDAIRIGFGQKVGQLCEKHPNIVLATLFPDLTSGTTTLYGCKNIIAAAEK
jgi:hypothetical protein